MENNKHVSPHLLLMTLIILTILTTTTNTSNTTTNNSTPPIPPQPTAVEEVNNILDALIGAGDTSINQWVSIITMSNPSLSLTLFIPQQQQQNNQYPMVVVDPFMFPYHVVPQRLTFSELLLFPRNARLPTLLPGKTIAVTDNSPANFSLDATPLTHPDLYSTPSIAVHCVQQLLDYSLFGALPPSPPFLPIGDSIGDATPWKSAASSTTTTLNLLFLFFFFFFFCFLLLFWEGFDLMYAWQKVLSLGHVV